jgi:hypothetical protein
VTDTPTATVTDTPTGTVTDTPTGTVTDTPTATVTDTPTATVTDTPTGTVTDTPTGTVTDTPTATVTDTPTATVTDTATATVTDTATATATNTAGDTQTPTATVTDTPTVTNTPTGTVTNTATNTATATNTRTHTGTATVTNTATPTRTLVPTITATFAEPTQEPIMAPDIALTKEFTSACLAGTNSTFEITIRNIGNVGTGVITLNDPIAGTMMLILPVTAPAGWDCVTESTPQLLKCTFAGPLLPTDPTVVITATVAVKPGAVLLVNEATATTPGDLNPDNDHDTATCQAGATPTPALSPFGLAAAVLLLGALAAWAMRRRRS